MKKIFFVLSVLLSGCSVERLVPGNVAHQVITCTSSQECKSHLAKDCPNGGLIHAIRQAVEIEYSCNS